MRKAGEGVGRRWRDLVGFAARRLGVFGALGALLIVGAPLAQVWLTHAAQQRLEATRAEHAVLRTKVSPASPVATPADRLVAFYAGLSLPAAADGERSPLEVIHSAARQHGVRLARGDYRSVRESSGRVLRYQLALPVKAAYPALRAWLAEVMNALPGAAIEGLSLKRDKVGGDTVEAQLRLVVYVRAD